MTTVTERALLFTRKVDALAEQKFGNSYTLKTTFWNDDDFRVIAYNSKTTEYEDRAYIELWYQDSEVDNDDAALKIHTRQTGKAPRTESKQIQVGSSEWDELPEIDQ